MTEWGEFFDEHADYTVRTGFYESRGHFTLEELYQAFKARLAFEQSESVEIPEPTL